MNLKEYQEKLSSILSLLKDEEAIPVFRYLCRTDLYFLLRHAMNRADLEHPWLFERCQEVQKDPNGHLDLWSRAHYKSTIITFGKTVQDVLASHGENPLPEWRGAEVTVGIFSHNRPMAKDFLRQIKREFEENKKLQGWFPDILHENPEKEAVKWSEDAGLIVKRKSNPKEATIEAGGIVEGQPTGKHYVIRVYDDLVHEKYVSNPEMIKKTTDSWATSLNLGDNKFNIERYIGTRYHMKDTYAEMMERKAVKTRIHRCTKDGTATGEPVLLTREEIQKKREAMGPYIFTCFAEGTRVLMSNWREKNIEDIRPGDEVVGYEFANMWGDKKRDIKNGMEVSSKSKLVRSKVLAIHSHQAEVVRFMFKSGRTVICTPEHKFWQGRATRYYKQLGFGYRDLKSAISIYDPRYVFKEFNTSEGGYLGGFFDGEGSVSGKQIHISQSETVNPHICRRIETCFLNCGFKFNKVSINSKSKVCTDYYLVGGRQAQMRFLHITGDIAKRKRIEDLLFLTSTAYIGYRTRNSAPEREGASGSDNLIGIEKLGVKTVYNIQTTTGNYIANGYAAKNCQMMLNPVGDDKQSFKQEWLNYYDYVPGVEKNMTRYILVDPASAKKKNSDYTVMWVIGLAPDGNYYHLEVIRDRLSLVEKANKLIHLHRKWKPTKVGYEQYGMQCDIQYIKEVQKQQNYRFNIIELGGAVKKEDRIRQMVPVYENGQFYLQEQQLYRDYQDQLVNLVQIFIKEEFLAFPVGAHDDMLDCLARIKDPELNALFPLSDGAELNDASNIGKRSRYSAKSGNRGSAWAF